MPGYPSNPQTGWPFGYARQTGERVRAAAQSFVPFHELKRWTNVPKIGSGGDYREVQLLGRPDGGRGEMHRVHHVNDIRLNRFEIVNEVAFHGLAVIVLQMQATIA